MFNSKLKLYFTLPALHILAIVGLFTVNNSAYAFLIAYLLYYPILLLGHNIGHHKLFSHRAFDPKPWYPYVAAFFGLMSWHSAPLISAMSHRVHHMYSDTDRDPSNRNRGFFYCWIGWMYTFKYQKRDVLLVRDLLRDWPWLEKVNKFAHIVPLSMYVIFYLISPLLGLSLLIASLCAFHTPTLTNTFLHANISGNGTEPINITFLAKWVNPTANHKAHHDNPKSLDYSTPEAKDWTVSFIKRFLAK